MGLDALSSMLERSWHALPMFRSECLRKSDRRVSPVWTAAVWVAISAGFGSAVPASAGECEIPVAAAPALAAQTPDARLRFIAQTLRQTARSERRYAGGWSLVYTGLAAGTWLFVPLSSDPRQYVESAFNTGTSLLAALLVVIPPIGVIRDQQRMERLLLQQGTGDVRCTVLAESERLLLHAADRQESARNALAHIGNVAVNVGLGLVLGYGLDRPQGAAVNTSVGIVLGELMIATRPRQALRSLERYRIGNLQPESETLTMPLSVTPLLMRSGYGVAVSSNF